MGVARCCMHKSTSKYISTVLFDAHLCDDIIRCQNDKIDADRIHFDMHSAKPFGLFCIFISKQKQIKHLKDEQRIV